MAQTYLELTQQIEELRHQADAIKGMEVAGVVERIKVAIEAYGLTVDQLFGAEARGSITVTPRSSPTGRPARNGASAPRFRDGSGNTWSGRGPRPGWVKAALAAGRSLDEFAVTSAHGPTTGSLRPQRGSSSPAAPNPLEIDFGAGAAEATSKSKNRVSKRSALAPKYKDNAGHSWSGRGPRPGWLKLALDTGKTLEQLTA